MATQNATITSSWIKIADSADSTLLIQASGYIEWADSTLLIQASGYIEWQAATMASESAPSVEGHTIAGRERALSRALIGDGHVYARLIAGGDSATLIVTGSSETLS